MVIALLLSHVWRICLAIDTCTLECELYIAIFLREPVNTFQCSENTVIQNKYLRYTFKRYIVVILAYCKIIIFQPQRSSA